MQACNVGGATIDDGFVLIAPDADARFRTVTLNLEA
jgi:hypothetical protein